MWSSVSNQTLYIESGQRSEREKGERERGERGGGGEKREREGEIQFAQVVILFFI